MFEDFIGKKYANLTIDKFCCLKKNGVPIFSVVCDCGSSYLKAGLDMLQSGKTIDCGCSKRNVDLIGQRFGKLKVLEKTDKRYNRGVVWLCQCDCGNIRYVLGKRLKTGEVKSCGCILRDKQHFAVKMPIHRIWDSMISRCYNPNRKFFNIYGGRGIRVCDEWLGSNPKGFSNFYNWAISNGYRDEKLSNGRNKLTLDRIDCDKDYSPLNCRWVTNEQQQRNKRADKVFEYNGETKQMKEWLKKYHLKCSDYYRLLFLGFTNLEILDFISQPKQIDINIYYLTIHKDRFFYTKNRKNIIDRFTNKYFTMNDEKFSTEVQQ